MDQTTLFISKIYMQCEYYLNCNGKSLTAIDNLSSSNQGDMLDIFDGIRDYISLIERPDKLTISDLLPEELINKDMVVTERRIFEIIKDLKDKIVDYQNYIASHLEKFKKVLSQNLKALGFIGSFPKYYRIFDEEILFLEYDEDIYLINEKAISKRIAMIVRIKKPDETIPNLDIENFSYLDLVTKYADCLQGGLIRSFMIHLPDLNYLDEITDEIIENDLKYLEILESVLSKSKKLPKWYINISKTAKDFERTYLIYSLVPVLLIVSIIGFIFFYNSSLGLMICYLIGVVLNFTLCKYFGKKTYNKYHPKENNQ